ncbi:MAG: pseudouridine synthase [candidate division Zixibacteria bacterium]|nr:pseudouridine synthase [candidate division Zixibacteria bacterium]
MIRINKFLSLCGVASRRKADRLIAEKRVSVNDAMVAKPGLLIDEINDIVKVDGVRAVPAENFYYILLNKPAMVLTTLSDPFHRKTVAHLIKEVPVRVYPVGRLDYVTEGVLLLTNDGETAHRLAHPRYEIKKIYLASVVGAFTKEKAKLIGKGIKLDDGHLGRAEVEILSVGEKKSEAQFTLTEGHKREIKQMLKAVGHPIQKLRRIEFAGFRVDDLLPGQWRYLDKQEIAKLKHMVGL